MTSGWRERVINEGTAFETTAYRFDADRDGPTAVVVGGQHGIEPAGWLAAEELLEYEPRAGTLVVIPRWTRLLSPLERTSATLAPT